MGRPKMTKAAHVRMMLQKMPNAAPKDIIAALAEKKIDVAHSTICNVRNSKKFIREIGGELPPKAKKEKKSDQMIAYSDVVLAMKMVNTIGVSRAKAAIDIVTKFAGKVQE